MRIDIVGGRLENGANKNDVLITTHGRDGNNTFTWPLDSIKKIADAFEKCRRQIPKLTQQYRDQDDRNDVITVDICKLSENKKIMVTVNKVNKRFYISASSHLYDDGDWHWQRKRCLRMDFSQDDMHYVYNCLTGKDSTDYFD